MRVSLCENHSGHSACERFLRVRVSACEGYSGHSACEGCSACVCVCVCACVCVFGGYGERVPKKFLFGWLAQRHPAHGTKVRWNEAEEAKRRNEARRRNGPRGGMGLRGGVGPRGGMEEWAERRNGPRGGMG